MRSFSAKRVITTRFKELPFTGKWEALVGRPEARGSIIIYGPSGNGKTRLALQLAKYLSGFTTVAYNSIEQGISKTMSQALAQEGLGDIGARFRFLDRAPMDQLEDWLSRPRRPNVIIIDSLQVAGISRKDVTRLYKKFKNKLFIWVCREDPKTRKPEGSLGRSVEYDADIKIRVEGYRAMAKSRYGGGEPFDVWPDEAAKYWPDNE